MPQDTSTTCGVLVQLDRWDMSAPLPSLVRAACDTVKNFRHLHPAKFNTPLRLQILFVA